MKHLTWTWALAALALVSGMAGAAPALIESHTLNNFGKRYAPAAGIQLADARGASALGVTDFARSLRANDILDGSYHDLTGAISLYGNLGAAAGPVLRHSYPELRASYGAQARAGYGAADGRSPLDSSSVPEPETYVMLAVGVAVIVLTRGTRKRLQDSLEA